MCKACFVCPFFLTHYRGFHNKVTKGLGPKPPKAEKPGGIPKIRKLATLRQYGFFYGIPPGFSPAERFFRQRPSSYGSYEGYWTQTVQPPVLGFVLDTPCFIMPPRLPKLILSYSIKNCVCLLYLLEM